MNDLATDPTKRADIRKELAVSGYLGCIGDGNVIIPSDIVSLCVVFYNEVGYWDINGEELEMFLNAKDGYKVFSKIFYHNQVQIKCGLIANERGCDEKKDKFSFQVFMEENVKKMVVFFHIYCVQTKRNVKYTPILKQCADTAIISSTIIDDGWAITNLPLFDCTPFNELNMRICVDILDIEYIKSAEITDYHKDIKMKKYVEYEWRVSDDLLIAMESCPIGKGYFSQCFDDENKNWSLLLLPKGRNGETENMTLLMLAINRVPNGLYKIEVKYTVRNNQNDKSFTKIEKFSYLWWTNYCQKDDALFISDILSSVDQEQGLIFYIVVEIVDLYRLEHNGLIYNAIPKDEWSQYGIIE